MGAPNGEAPPRAEAREDQDVEEYVPVEDAADLEPEEPPAAVRRSEETASSVGVLDRPRLFFSHVHSRVSF